MQWDVTWDIGPGCQQVPTRAICCWASQPQERRLGGRGWVNLKIGQRDVKISLQSSEFREPAPRSGRERAPWLIEVPTRGK